MTTPLQAASIEQQIRGELRRSLIILGGKPADIRIIDTATQTNHEAVNRKFE